MLTDILDNVLITRTKWEDPCQSFSGRETSSRSCVRRHGEDIQVRQEVGRTKFGRRQPSDGEGELRLFISRVHLRLIKYTTPLGGEEESSKKPSTTHRQNDRCHHPGSLLSLVTGTMGSAGWVLVRVQIALCQEPTSKKNCKTRSQLYQKRVAGAVSLTGWSDLGGKDPPAKGGFSGGGAHRRHKHSPKERENRIRKEERASHMPCEKSQRSVRRLPCSPELERWTRSQ